MSYASPFPPRQASLRDTDSPFSKFHSHNRRSPGMGFYSQNTSYGQRRRRRVRIIRYLVLFALLAGVVWLVWGSSDDSEVKKWEEKTRKVVFEPIQEKANEWVGRVQGKGMATKSSPATERKFVLGQEKASMVMLVRNRELGDALASMKQVEDRFNKKFHYPWTFLNDEPFTDEFINHTSIMASGPTEYGVIDKTQWSMPEHIDEEKFQGVMEQMRKDDVIYGDSRTYRHMCRYNSGFFFQHPTLAKYDWYWRVEPSIGFYCDVDYDPFAFMRKNDKKYSFVITLPEYDTTIKTLWKTTQGFFSKHPEHLAPYNALDFIVDGRDWDDASNKRTGKTVANSAYNLCHFWSNFEIASLTWLRSKPYMDYFQHLDEAGGFYYERWGDAPVHSLAAALLLNKTEIHHFSDMGYKHVPFQRCPLDDESYKYARCICPFEQKDNFDTSGWSCLPKWWHVNGLDPQSGKPKV